MAKDEDTLPSEYKYVWKPSSDTSLDDFLKKYKPSMVQNDGTKPWIWVTGNKDHAIPEGQTDAIEEASEILKETTEKVESIKNDASIPVRSNKKTGARSKKEVREEVQAEATKKLKEVSQKHSYVTGKWLIFAPADKVDLIWSGIARSLVTGPLASTAAFTAKVSTSPEHDQPNYQHVMCIYVPDVYDKDAMAEIMRILLRNHGVSLSGVKSDLYTYIGIDSKHPSGIPSTIWKNSAVIPDAEAKELKDTFYKELAEKKQDAPDADKAAAVSSADPSAPAADKPAAAPKKPLLKKKKAKDPFASDSEEENEPKEETKDIEPPSKTKPPSRSSAKPPSRSNAKPPSKTASKPPSQSSVKPTSRSSAKPPSTRSSKPPSKTTAPTRTTRKRKAEPILEGSETESDDEPKPKKKAPAKKPSKKRAKVDESEEDED
ncbi:hypothetical protein K523DRAFT_418813 [Schizophyllum commune Tattone D]|nr:hypothetical protein K523DRAFT_418813 [Schizophyllum commune Tattone D]